MRGIERFVGNFLFVYGSASSRPRTCADGTESSGGIWERFYYDCFNPNHVALATTDSKVCASRQTYIFTRQPDGTTDIDVEVIREGQNLRVRLLGFVLRTIGRGAHGLCDIALASDHRWLMLVNRHYKKHVIYSSYLRCYDHSVDEFIRAIARRENASVTFFEFIVRLRIAKEHGGRVYLDESHRERTVFTLSLTKNRSLPFRET